jgi:hypothetical protein
MLKKARLLTHPTLARQDAPCPWQVRSSETDPRFTFYASRFSVLGGEVRTTHGKRRISARRGRAGEKSDFFSILLGYQDRRSRRPMARHPAATPAANIAPIIQPEEKPVPLGSRRRSSRFRLGIWDSGPSHSSSDERVEPFLKRMAVIPSLMTPLLPCTPTHTNSISAAKIRTC